MRLTRLALERYGHVSGEYLEFPSEFGLHIVLGANEAGKSTALEAVADGLFGFPTRRARLNHPDDPRVGFTLQLADGTEASFVRRKTGRDKLLDASGAAVTEAALARFLGGNGRERFQQVFGLDAERLRQAGRAIMAEQGEAGAAILQAQTGLHGLRGAVDRLDEAAKQLFGDGRGQRRISAALVSIKENRKLVADRSVSGPDYLRALTRETDLQKQIADIDAERQALRSEQARLSRIRGTAPFRSELAEIAAKLEDLGPAQPLPPDAAVQQESATRRRDDAKRDRLREAEEVEAIEEELGKLQSDPEILHQAAAILSLEADLSRVADARRDHVGVSGKADASLAAVDVLARRLGIAERGAALRERLPNIVTKHAASTLLTQHSKHLAAREIAEQALRIAGQEAEDAATAHADSPVPDEAEALRRAVDEVRDAGPVDAELAKAEALRETTAAKAQRGLAALALWSGSLTALEARSVPLEAEAFRLGVLLDEADNDCAKTGAVLHQHDGQAEAYRADIQGIEAAGPLPTADAIGAVRARRDLAWRLTRRVFVDGGPAPTPSEWDGAPPAASELPDLFESLLRDADVMADARNSELARVQDWERLRVQSARIAALRPGQQQAHDTARQQAEAVQAEWRKAWAQSGIEPLDPAAMREWVRDRAAVLACAGAARDAAEAHRRLAERHDKLRSCLVATLPSVGGVDIAAMLREAIQTLHQRDHQSAQRTAAAERSAKAVGFLTEARRQSDRLDERGALWAGQWAPVAQRLGVPLDTDPQAATDFLSTWSEIDKELERGREHNERLADMRLTIDQHDAEVVALAARLFIPVVETLVPALAERLRRAGTVSIEQVRLDKARADRTDLMGQHQRAETTGEAELVALRQVANVADDAGLLLVIAVASKRVELTRQRQDHRANLRSLADGKTDAELIAEAALIEIDGVPGRLDAIAGRMAALDTAAGAGAADLAQAKQELHAMQAGQDVAGPTQAIQDSLAAIEDDAHRYVRLRLAHALLRGGVDGYRRSQQGPLLAKASMFFAEMTGERYVRLEQDENEKGEPFIVAVRPDSSTCPAGSLSEGTMDQLFLALRLASIALDAAASEPLPFIADDLLVNFDDDRARAALGLLAAFGRTVQVILFTHHRHLLKLVPPGTASVHDLPRGLTT